MLTWANDRRDPEREPRLGAGRGVRMGERLRGLRHRRRNDNVFETLEVQLALTRIDQEIKQLRFGRGDDFAGAHHLRAAMKAYDYLLADACRLAGVVQEPDAPVEVRRMLAEAELQARGWDW